MPLPPRPDKERPLTIIGAHRRELVDDDMTPLTAADTEPSPAPDNPSLRDLYALIDARVPPDIRVRISSLPPPAPLQSIPVRAAKATGRWGKWAMAAIGVLAIVGEFVADVERLRGPLSQVLVIVARVLDAQETPAPETPEPPSGETPP